MKRLYILLCLLGVELWVMPWCGSLLAQELVSIKRVGDRIRVVYALPDYKTKRDYMLTVSPILTTDKHEEALPQVVLVGSQKQKLETRRAVLNKTEKPVYAQAGGAQGDSLKGAMRRERKARRDTVFFALSTHEWLLRETVDLRVRREQEGCCSTLVEDTVCGCAFSYVAGQDRLPGLHPVRSRVPDFTIIDSLHSGVLHPMSEYEPYTPSRILSREEGALYVHFPIDDSRLTRSFRDNGQTLDSIMFLVEQLMADTVAQIKKIQIVGLASVDGELEHNYQLAGDRADALKRYIQEEWGEPNMDDEMFEVANGGEAWSELCYQVEAVQFDGRQQVLQIIREEQDLEERERKIKQVRQGAAYEYIRENLLHDQRNSGYIRVYYEIAPDEAARAINEAIALLQAYRWDEALALLLPYAEDERAWTALGVALYMTGDEEAAAKYGVEIRN